MSPSILCPENLATLVVILELNESYYGEGRIERAHPIK